MYFTSKEGHKNYMMMNTHRCRTCRQVFVNFKGMKEHLDNTKHNNYELIWNKQKE